MKTLRIIHQQVMQIRWPLLVCLGLIMVLPLEEAAVNVSDQEGFYSRDLLGLTYLLAPFLAGLIACANVQADLDEKRYSFWRSKPVGVLSFVTIKYVTGLLLAAVVLVVPFLFAVLTTTLAGSKEAMEEFAAYFVSLLLISFLSYSLCFLCNVLIRKTARAWLMGMALTGFLLIVPFMLPLDLRHIVSDSMAVTSRFYLFLILIAAFTAAVIALAAAQRDWRLHTNLKGLLCAAAALIFLLLMLAARQVANIKVLDEMEYEMRLHGFQLQFINDQLYLEMNHEKIEIQNGRFHMAQRNQQPSEETLRSFRRRPPLYEVDKSLDSITYPGNGLLYHQTDGQIYAFKLVAYYDEQKEKDARGRDRTVCVYKHIFLHSYQFTDAVVLPIAALDLSSCLRPDSSYLAMRLIDGKIVALAGNQCVTIDITRPDHMIIIDQKPVRRFLPAFVMKEKFFKVPLIPADSIDLKERIRFSIDLNFNLLFKNETSFTDRTSVDMYDNQIYFYFDSMEGISRYKVNNWNKDYIYCEYQNSRPITAIEAILGERSWQLGSFVQDGKYYLYQGRRLMVFDVRSDRIRKLGHFERISKDFRIEDLEVLDDGRIVMSAITGQRKFGDGRSETMGVLYLLENPE